ncbi:TOMM system kinase/cyclase fusion protein [Xanthovirga aplysinae]|uniref:TOMM system kinase/cyclase fusion protein n=1 Tax=Xanthovirga aplysinae TaxID=2529853 RepID=UPI0012BC48B8|nr:TOMM system kinase/cyclase fusion protein [Xanthovirga aplysinae]MTI32495.1 TOMM system kinase/cyclase fusion protein [Xanthovirga aplysinae]
MGKQLIDQTLEPVLTLDNYVSLQKIGEGGYGLVYKAKQLSTGQTVALKTLKFQDSLDPQKKNHQIARFERETRLCAEINHPHIVRLLDKGFTKNGEPFAVFEYVSGETLKDLIIQKGSLSANDTKELMGQVLDALACAHTKGIVHRDLKPHNIMVTQTGSKSHVKILDFGIGAFTHHFRNLDYKSLTLTQEVVGTPAYSAPEQLRGEPPTIKSDLYAWGLILLECLSGETVMRGDSIAEVFQQQLSAANVPFPPSIAGHPLADLLRRVLEKNPRLRIANAPTLFEEYTGINFSTLVGEINPQKLTVKLEEALTQANQLAWNSAKSERRQITVLCVKLSLLIPNKSLLDLEILDTIQKDQMNLCIDTAIRFGGHIAGSLADNVMIYFGYPQISDNDARRAGRTALELVSQVQKRSALLFDQQGIQLDIRMGMNSGTILTRHHNTPVGMVPNLAFNLLYNAKPGTVLVGETTKKLLNPYLKFEKAEKYHYPNAAVQSYLLTGERQTEALSFLNPWSANRKMIGREKELQKLLDFWTGVKGGKGQAALIQGQAGIGKSKLIYEGKKCLRDKGYLVAECRCLPEHQNNALYPFFELLKKHLGIQDTHKSSAIIPKLEKALEGVHCEIKTSLTILCSWLSIPLNDSYQPSQASPEEQKKILFETLEKCILHFGVGKSFLLIVEDLHWIDPTSLEFLDRLLQSINKENYLLLLTARPEFEPNWEGHTLNILKLNNLKKSFTKALVEGVLDQKPIEEAALQYIAQRTDGIPLFIEELTHMLLDQNYLIFKNEKYQLVDNLDEKSVPVTLKDLLNARLNRLGLAKETAQVAATIGREFSYELLLKASLRDEAMVQADLDLLMNADLIYRQRRVNGESYIFRHALIRDAAYGGMVSSIKKETHARITTILKNEYAEQVAENPFEVAYHSAGAFDFKEASDYGIKAIKKQIENSANKEALKLNELILKWIKQIENKLEGNQSELRLNVSMLPVYTMTSGWGNEKLETLVHRNHELINYIQEHGKEEKSPEIEDQILKSEWILFSNYHSQAKRKKARELGESILKKIKGTQNNHRLEMVVSAFLGQAYISDGDFQLAKKMLKTVLNCCEKKKDYNIHIEYGFDPYVHAKGNLSLLTYSLGFPETALLYTEQGIKYAKLTKNKTIISIAYVFGSLLAALLNKKAETKKLLKEAYKIYEGKIPNDFIEGLLFIIEDWSNNSTTQSRKILKKFLIAKQNTSLSWYELLLADTYLNKGDFSEAKSLMLSSINRGKKHNENCTFSISFRLLGLACYKQSQHLSKESEKYFLESIMIAQNQKTSWLELQATFDYCKILLQENKKENIKKMLSPVLNKITEGFQSKLYLNANKLLEKLNKC